MKIAIINQPQDPVIAADEQHGSVAIVNWALARCLARRHQVIFYAPRHRGQSSAERWGGIEIRRIGFVARRLHKSVQLLVGRFGRRPYFASRLYYKEYFWQIANALAAEAPQIVHLPNQMQFADLFKRTTPRSKVVMHMHQDELARLDLELLHRDLAQVDAIATVSEFLTAGARKRLPQLAARIRTIGNGVDLKRFSPGARARHERGAPLRLLFVGRISPEKGVHLLIEAFDRLVRAGLEAELALIGKPGMMPFDLLSRLLADDAAALDALRAFYGRSVGEWLTREILGHRRSYPRALHRRLSAAACTRVRFLGSMPQSELVRRYHEADLLVLPSIWQESYGLPVAEAMACGVPVLASASGGVPELVEDGVTGRLVPRLDVAALAHALQELAADRTRLEEMGHAARARAERHLGWRMSAARLERLYRETLAPHPVSVPGELADVV